jgi:hypothetical protein
LLPGLFTLLNASGFGPLLLFVLPDLIIWPLPSLADLLSALLTQISITSFAFLAQSFKTFSPCLLFVFLAMSSFLGASSFGPHPITKSAVKGP